MAVTEPPRSIFLVTGEPSGDALGGALIAALQQRTGGNLRIAGIGGEHMRERGLVSLAPLEDLAIGGVAEVLPRAPIILRWVRKTVAAIRELRPDAVVTIDSSGFTWRIAHRLRRCGETLPLIHYVAPMVWAWRAGRARRMARWYDHLMTLLPFEPPYFERVGLSCSYVGHPVLESGADRGDGGHAEIVPDFLKNVVRVIGQWQFGGEHKLRAEACGQPGDGSECELADAVVPVVHCLSFMLDCGPMLGNHTERESWS